MATGIPAARLALYEDHQDTRPLVEDYAWAELVADLTEHEFTDCTPCPGGQACKAKYTLAFSPGAPREGTTRADRNVDSVSLLVYDFDHLTRSELEGVVDRLTGLECVLYSTHSHQHHGPDDCCVRIVFPLSRPLAPAEFRWVRSEVIRRYHLEWQRPTGQRAGADPNPKDLSRLYFYPTAPVGNETEAGHQQGVLLDLAELLRGMPSSEKPRLTVVPPDASAPLPASNFDMAGLRELLKGYRPKGDDDDANEVISKKELVRRVQHAEPLVKPEEEGQREKSCHRLGKILAWLLPASVAEEALVELVRPSVSRMPVYDTDGEDDTLEARFTKLTYSWRRGVSERLEKEKVFKAERDAQNALTRKMRERFKMGSRPQAQETEETAQETEELEVDEEADAEWTEVRDALIYKQTKQGPVLLAMLANVIMILSHHPLWRDRLRYNEITKNIDILGGPLAAYEKKPTQVITGTKNWLQSRFEAGFSTADVQDGLVHVAKATSYNPLQEYLERIQADDVPRIDSFLEHYCGAALVDSDGADISGYVRKVSRRWLLSAVARAFQPGCKMDTVLILEGKTGIYKSTALKALGGPFFSDSKIVVGEKDAMQLAGTNWIHEIAELTAFHASETETQKAFFSSPVDQFRAPYDKVPDKYPRLACFVGSTNDERYMNDPTGNRRYWPVRCDRPFHIRELRRDRDLLWAEAVQVYRAGLTCLKCQALNVGLPQPWFEQYAHERCEDHRWWFDGEENEVLEKINVHRLKADFAVGIRDYLLRLSPQNRREAYTLYEIATDFLKIPPERIASQAPAIGRALKVLGFEKERVREEGSREWRHLTPADILTAKKKPPAHMKLVEGGKETKP